MIDTSLPPGQAVRNLLSAVRTDLLVCAQCAQNLTGGAHFCSYCGQPAPPPIPRSWAQRNFSRDGFQFEGRVTPLEFELTRLIYYRNACIPVIRGRFEPSATGTRIVIEMSLHPVGYVFLIGGAGLSFFAFSALAAGGQGLPVTALAAFAVPCLFGLVCWAAFTAEASTARRALSRLWPVP